jgi:hypothetical protein
MKFFNNFILFFFKEIKDAKEICKLMELLVNYIKLSFNE